MMKAYNTFGNAAKENVKGYSYELDLITKEVIALNLNKL